MDLVALAPDDFHLAGFKLPVAQVEAGGEFLQNVLIVVLKDGLGELELAGEIAVGSRIAQF